MLIYGVWTIFLLITLAEPLIAWEMRVIFMRPISANKYDIISLWLHYAELVFTMNVSSAHHLMHKVSVALTARQWPAALASYRDACEQSRTVIRLAMKAMSHFKWFHISMHGRVGRHHLSPHLVPPRKSSKAPYHFNFVPQMAFPWICMGGFDSIILDGMLKRIVGNQSESLHD